MITRPMPEPPASMLAYVGCRTTRERNGRGEGISVFRVDMASGAWTPVQVLAGIANPSFLALDKEQRTLFTVEGDGSHVTSFRIEAGSGRISAINRQDAQGRNGVHLTKDPSGRFMLVSNYATSTLAALPVDGDGMLGPVADLYRFTGELGPHKVQQLGHYPHHNPYDPSGRFLVVPDKGGDQVCVVRFDAERGRFAGTQPPASKSRPGAGPRHIDFHPTRPFAYLANELDSTIAAYGWDAASGTLTPIQLLSSLPDTFFGVNTTAEIQVSPSGRHVYISNRGHDSIAIFAIDQASGRLAPLGWQSTRGRQPRFFTLDPWGRFLCAANELTDTIEVFRIDQRHGTLTHTGHAIATPSPTCVVFRTAP